MKKLLILTLVLLTLTACGKNDGVLPEIEPEMPENIAVSPEMPELAENIPEPEEDTGLNGDFLAKYPIGKLEGLTFSAQLEEGKLLMSLDTAYDVTVEGAYLCHLDTALWYTLDWRATGANTLEADWPEELTDGAFYAVLDVKVPDSEGIALTSFLVMGNYETPQQINRRTLLYIGDAVYEAEYSSEQLKTAVPGEPIGVCQWNISDHLPKVEVPDYVEIRSTDVPWGEMVYQQEGYDPSFRVCARIERGGEIYSFRRNLNAGGDHDDTPADFYDGSKRPIDMYGDFSDQVELIRVDIGGYIAAGEIYGHEARELTSKLLNCVYELYDPELEIDDKEYYLLTMVLKDGSRERAVINNGLCIMTATFYVQEDILAQLREAVVYSVKNIPDNANSGGIVATSAIEDEERNWTDEEIEWVTLRSGMEARIDTVEGDALYYTYGVNVQSRSLIDPGSVSSVQKYKKYIYYINSAGEIIRLHRFEKKDEMGFMIAVGEDGVLSHVKLETIDPGPYTKLRIVGECFYTLDAAGTLKADGEVIAENVTDFEPDYDGVCYVDDSGLWRLKDGQLTCIAQGDIDCFAFAAAKVFYSTGGEVMKVRLADGVTESLGRMDARRMVWTTVDSEECLITADEQGCLTVRFLEGNRRSFVIAESGVEVIGLEGNYDLVAGGSDEMYYVDLIRLREQNDSDDWTPGDLGEYTISTRTSKLIEKERAVWCSKVRDYNNYDKNDIITHSKADDFAEDSYGYTAIEKLAELLDITSSEEDCRWTISETDLGWLLEHPDGTAYEMDIEARELKKVE